MVIPAYNEEDFLPPLLASVQRARDLYSGGADAIEVVVADNGSSDKTAQLASEADCRVVFVEKRVIAAARNGGAAAAKGEILAFIDADSLMHPDTFNAIERILAKGTCIVGTTGVTMSRWSPGIALTYGMIVPLAWLTKFDTGVVFCRRSDFEQIGGYCESLTYAEDVRLLMDLRRLGKHRGQKICRLRGAKAVTSTRKYDRYGDWHMLRLIFSFPFRYFFHRRSADRIAREYWYDR